MTAGWAALCSGGKDSLLAIREAREAGRAVDRLVTVEAPPGSYLYHVPATLATPAIATALGVDIDLLTLESVAEDSAAAARTELAPLRRWAADTDAAGVVSGVVASAFQRDLLAALCADHGLALETPLWGWSGRAVLERMLEAELAVDVVAVSAAGLDRRWLGRRLDRPAVDELLALAERYGFHPAGEGGEFETLVVDAPAYAAPLRYRATPAWDGVAGHLSLESVSLATPSDVSPDSP